MKAFEIFTYISWLKSVLWPIIKRIKGEEEEEEP